MVTTLDEPKTRSKPKNEAPVVTATPETTTEKLAHYADLVRQGIESIKQAEGLALQRAIDLAPTLRDAKELIETEGRKLGITWDMWCRERARMTTQTANFFIKVADNWGAMKLSVPKVENLNDARRWIQLVVPESETGHGGARPGAGRKPKEGTEGDAETEEGTEHEPKETPTKMVFVPKTKVVKFASSPRFISACIEDWQHNVKDVKTLVKAVNLILREHDLNVEFVAD